MLNVEVNRSAEGVEGYFDRELAVSDYLMREPGVWAGRGAARTPWSGGTVPVRRIVAKRASGEWHAADGRMNTIRQESGAERARCCIQSSSVAIPGRLTD